MLKRLWTVCLAMVVLALLVCTLIALRKRGLPESPEDWTDYDENMAPDMNVSAEKALLDLTRDSRQDGKQQRVEAAFRFANDLLCALMEDGTALCERLRLIVQSIRSEQIPPDSIKDVICDSALPVKAKQLAIIAFSLTYYENLDETITQILKTIDANSSFRLVLYECLFGSWTISEKLYAENSRMYKVPDELELVWRLRKNQEIDTASSWEMLGNDGKLHSSLRKTPLRSYPISPGMAELAIETITDPDSDAQLRHICLQWTTRNVTTLRPQTAKMLESFTRNPSEEPKTRLEILDLLIRTDRISSVEIERSELTHGLPGQDQGEEIRNFSHDAIIRHFCGKGDAVQVLSEFLTDYSPEVRHGTITLMTRFLSANQKGSSELAERILDVSIRDRSYQVRRRAAYYLVENRQFLSKETIQRISNLWTRSTDDQIVEWARTIQNLSPNMARIDISIWEDEKPK